jgi:5-methylcytosine-specific restriction endonuclease McrA
MDEKSLSQEIAELLKKSKLPKQMKQLISNSKLSKRAQIVVRHILRNGSITTEDIEGYGYKHPPRAIGDVRDAGISLKMSRVLSSDERRIGKYEFADLTQVQEGRLDGREVFPKPFRAKLFAASNGRCAICSGKFESRYLQIDHRIPYRIAGEKRDSERDARDYTLVCGSCNRAKSWSCEHCPNWSSKSAEICSKCYWASPEDYTHIALREVRRADILWDENEVQVYEQLKGEAQKNKHTIPDYVKEIIAKHLRG